MNLTSVSRFEVVIITPIFLVRLSKASWLILKGAGGIVNVLNMVAKTVAEQDKAVIINDLMIYLEEMFLWFGRFIE